MTETDNADRNVPDDAAARAAAAEAVPSDLAAVQADIERTRADLTRTVDQLTAKFDVKTRLRRRMADTKDGATRGWEMLRERATDEHGTPTPPVIGAGVGAVVGAVAIAALIGWRRSRSSRRQRRWQR